MLYRILGIFSLGLGGLGVILPLLPTTCFVLFAAWCFARSSKSNAWYRWLVEHRLWGPIITQWERQRCISPKIRLIAVSSILISGAYSFWLLTNPWLQALLVTLMSAGIISLFSIKCCRLKEQ